MNEPGWNWIYGDRIDRRRAKRLASKVPMWTAEDEANLVRRVRAAATKPGEGSMTDD